MSEDFTNPPATAGLVRASAHAARNSIATVRAALQLIDDAEIVEALSTATSELQVLLERAGALARVDLGEAGDVATVHVEELLQWAAQRAGREGRDGAGFIAADVATVRVEVQALLAERLIADIIHVSSDGPNAIGSEHDVRITAPIVEPLDDAVAAYLQQLAVACGARIELRGDEIELRFARI